MEWHTYLAVLGAGFGYGYLVGMWVGAALVSKKNSGKVQ